MARRTLLPSNFGNNFARYNSGLHIQKIASLAIADTGTGWCYPGGLTPTIFSTMGTQTQLLKQFTAFTRDLHDNSSLHHGSYPLACYTSERVSATDVLIDVGGLRCTLWQDRLKGKDFRYLRRSEIDWEAVGANGGLGDLVVMEDEEMFGAVREPAPELIEPWENRVKACVNEAKGGI
jgi:hypothetical protein